jgi:hypothetical protein
MACVVGLVALAGAAGLIGASPASAAPTTSLVYSTDSGSTWVTNPTLTSGQQVLVREYYNNDTSATIPATSLTTSLPAGFTLVAGSTTVCLNPGTTDPTHPTAELACNTDAGQGGAINEGAVWSGGTLTISPTAGLLTQPTNATSGILQVGEFKYLSLDQCAYDGSVAQPLVYAVPSTGNTPPFSAGTTASNTAQAAPVCGPGTSAYAAQAANSGVANISLLGQRYLNLDQCFYDNSGIVFTQLVSTTPNAPNHFTAATTASNTQPASQTCGAGAGAWAYQAGNSGIANVDLLGNSTLNLDQCAFDGTVQDPITYFVPHTPNPPFSAATGASGSSPASPTCGVGTTGYAPQAANSGVANIGLVDPTRGQGFVQFAMTAPTVTSTITEPQTCGLTGAGTGNPTCTGNVTITATVGAPLLNLPVAVVALGLVGLIGLAVWYRRTTAANAS